MAERQTRTTCPYCGVGCGVLVRSDGAELLPVAGDATHPANLGRLCVKGSALHETVGLSRRLLQPEVDGREVDWGGAFDAVVSRLEKTVRDHGPQSVALYLSGQLLTEDYYVANKLWKGFLGSANVDTNSRLCMSSAVAAQSRAFGEDAVPGCYEDLELADLVVLVGSNSAWAHPVLHQRLLAARRQRPGQKLVVIDPRRTESCDQADLHLALAPGGDAFLFNGLLHYLVEQRAVDSAYIEAHTSGFGAAIAAAESLGGVEDVAALCGLDAAAVALFFRWFSETPRTVTLFSQGINQSTSGTDKGNAIINCHLATGRVGKPGASPFSITGQPNAMGGREVGGLANQLAVHRGFTPESIAAVGEFWNAPSMAQQPGLKAVELFEAIERGQIKFLWIMATNPLVSLPEADRWRRALARCETVVVSDCVRATDTTALAHILLPATGWGEKDGTVTNSERRISRQRKFLPAAGSARPDWWIVSQVAQRLGFGAAFAYRSPRDVFVEYAALSTINRDSPLRFDIGGLAALDEAGYDALAPVQWPVPAWPPHGDDETRLFGDGRFATTDGRARFIAIEPRWPEREAGVEALPFVFNTGRARDHWHTMTRTAESERLNRHRSEPYVEIHPEDALRCGLRQGDVAELHNRHGRAWLRVRVEPGQRPGSLFAPMHWSDRFAARARVDALVPAAVDPVSGQPELKHARVALRPLPLRWRGLLVSAVEPALPRDDYWAAAPIAGGWVYWLAGCGDWREAQAALMALLPGAAQLQFVDDERCAARCAWFAQERLQAALLLSADDGLPEPWWLAQWLGQELSAADRRVLLTGQPPGAGQAQGAIICSCFQVAETPIRAAIAGGCADSEQLGSALRCGTNCGSCVPELNRLLREMRTTDRVGAG